MSYDRDGRAELIWVAGYTPKNQLRPESINFVGLKRINH